MQIRVSNEDVAKEIARLAKDSKLSENQVGNLCIEHGLPEAKRRIQLLSPAKSKKDRC